MVNALPPEDNRIPERSASKATEFPAAPTFRLKRPKPDIDPRFKSFIEDATNKTSVASLLNLETKLTEPVINFYANLLQHDRGGFYCIDPLVLQQQNTVPIEHLNLAFMKKNNYRYVLIPMHRGVHWYLVVVVPFTLTIHILDSNAVFMDLRHRKDLEKVKILVKGLLEPETKRQTPDWDLAFETTPQQKDDHSCGVYLLAFMESVTRPGALYYDINEESHIKKIKFQPDHVEDFRLQVYQQILIYKSLKLGCYIRVPEHFWLTRASTNFHHWFLDSPSDECSPEILTNNESVDNPMIASQIDKCTKLKNNTLPDVKFGAPETSGHSESEPADEKPPKSSLGPSPAKNLRDTSVEGCDKLTVSFSKLPSPAQNLQSTTPTTTTTDPKKDSKSSDSSQARCEKIRSKDKILALTPHEIIGSRLNVPRHQQPQAPFKSVVSSSSILSRTGGKHTHEKISLDNPGQVVQPSANRASQLRPSNAPISAEVKERIINKLKARQQEIRNRAARERAAEVENASLLDRSKEVERNLNKRKIWPNCTVNHDAYLANQAPVAQHPHEQQQTLPVKNVSMRYQCKMCPKVFMSRDELKHHHKSHQAKPHKCSQCQKAFAFTSSLSEHMKKHLGTRPYSCDICYRKFTQLCHLQQHNRTHTGDRPYKCNYENCGKRFIQLSNLRTHERIHTGEKPYKCNYKNCEKRFPQLSNLQYHIKRIHPGDKL